MAVLSRGLNSGFAFVFLVLIAVTAAEAQITATAIRGLVRDQTGAVIAGAAIKLVDSATGVERNSVSNSDGSFLFTTLQAGAYRLTTSATGFRNSVVNILRCCCPARNRPTATGTARSTACRTRRST